jgi:hypothetical protein
MMKGRIILGLLPALLFAAACGQETAPTALTSDLAVGADHLTDPAALAFIEVCKAGVGSGSFAVAVNGLFDGQLLETAFNLDAGNCLVVATADPLGPISEVNVSITETPAAGTLLTGAVAETLDFVGNTGSTAFVNGATATATGDSRIIVTFTNEAEPPPPSLPGRMTGGGSAFTSADVRVTHGFELHCDLSDPNRLEVNWEGNRFHMTELSSALCTDDPAFDEGSPKAGFDTFDGTGVGRYNGVDGFDIVFQFVDDGQPGTGDIARIVITDPSNGDAVVMSVANYLVKGNHQAHK